MLKELHSFLKEKYKKEAHDISEIIVSPGIINGYNEVFLLDTKIGSVDLSPADEEYYFIDNIPKKSLAICSIEVEPQFRGKGFFSKILNWIYSSAKENNYTSIFLRVDDDSSVDKNELEDIYLRKGFQYFDVDSDSIDLDEQTYMIKYLNIKTASQLELPFNEQRIESLQEALSTFNNVPLQETLDNINAFNIKIKPLNKIDGTFEYFLVDLNGSNFEIGEHDSNILLLDAENDSSSEFTPATEWLYNIMNPEEYIEQKDPLESFWSDGTYVYHGTEEDNLESILTNGLMADSRTRGLSNRGIGDAVFTTFDPEEAERYGDIVLQIDIGSMKNNGITFPVQMETDFEDAEVKSSLAHMLGLRYYEPEIEHGMSDQTVVIHGNIPPQFIRVYDF